MLQMLQFQEERLWGAASGLITLEQCVEKTIEYTRERKTFGQPLINNQSIHFRLAELQTEIELIIGYQFDFFHHHNALLF